MVFPVAVGLQEIKETFVLWCQWGVQRLLSLANLQVLQVLVALAFVLVQQQSLFASV
jgi:hypothetical protein